MTATDHFVYYVSIEFFVVLDPRYLFDRIFDFALKGTPEVTRVDNILGISTMIQPDQLYILRDNLSILEDDIGTSSFFRRQPKR